ncbi:MAG: 3-isopropylmalate dehydrogenase [Clostridia bacterium]
MNINLAVIKGDGIGPEIVDEALKVLNKIGDIYGHTFNYNEVLAGGCAIDEFDEPLPQSTIDACKASDSILLGAVGGEKWDNRPTGSRPENALLNLRKEFNLFSNLRPAKIYSALKDSCPLKCKIVGDGLDMVIVRELTGDVYFGEKSRDDKGSGFDVMTYSIAEVERIARNAFEIAMVRSKKLCSVDKANVLETSRVWRETVAKIAKEYPEVELTNMYVDNAAMQLVMNPRQFDVIVTGNLFGDILSDEASMITGSIGMLPSASLNEKNFGMFEPIHGSAPDIAGKGIANPIATVLSCAMMLKYTFGLLKEAESIENAINDVLNNGFRTKDISKDGEKTLSTSEMGAKILEYIK